MPMTEEEKEMLAELRAISNKSSAGRFDDFEKKVVSSAGASQEGGDFLRGNPEDPALNQYWYSPGTIEALAEESRGVVKGGGRVAFLSTPSVYFALTPEERVGCKVYDYDRKWKDDPGYAFYDYNDPLALPDSDVRSFDAVVIDPPFITRTVWEKYTETAKKLLSKGTGDGGIVIGTTVQENAPFMMELLNCKPQAFKPSIPNLVYQYNSYANFDTIALCKTNPEIPE